MVLGKELRLHKLRNNQRQIVELLHLFFDNRQNYLLENALHYFKNKLDSMEIDYTSGDDIIERAVKKLVEEAD